MFDEAKLRVDLEKAEGFRPVVYDDATGTPIVKGSTVVGNPTLAIGWNVAGNPISLDRARVILEWHILDKTQELFAALPWARDLDEVRCRALMNMSFMGVANLLTFHKMLAALQTQRWADASAEALNSKWAGQVGARAQRIARMFASGADDAGLIA